MNNSTLDIIKIILDRQMNMPAGRVFAYNGSQDLPKDRDMFIVLSIAEQTPYSNNIRYKSTNEGLVEIQTQNISEDIIISCCSVTTEARDRAKEVNWALKSYFAQYQQEKYKIHISQINPVRDKSFLEETAMLNRFDTEIRVLRGYTKETLIDYYDKFPITSEFEPNFYIDT